MIFDRSVAAQVRYSRSTGGRKGAEEGKLRMGQMGTILLGEHHGR